MTCTIVACCIILTGCISPTGSIGLASKMVKSKRQVSDMRGKHHVTQRALSHICRDIKKHGMVQATSRTTMQRQRSDFAKRQTPFGTLIQERQFKLKNGRSIGIPLLHPMAMLWVCLNDCPQFKAFFSSVLKGQRLKIVEYADEVTPGRELVKFNDKKLWVFYWSFLDFGPAALANEDTWFTGLCIRSNMVKNRLAGGMGQIFKIYNRMFFAEGCDFRMGITLNVTSAGSAPASAESAPAPATSLVFANLQQVVQDADAHQQVYDWKGANGVKCCPKCWNIVSKNCLLKNDPTGGTVPIYTTDTSRWRPMTDTTFRSLQKRLHQLALDDSPELPHKEQDFGFNYNPHSWLQDSGLEVQGMRILAYDWMHCWCEGGAWEVELAACLRMLSKHESGARQLHAYLQQWMWPKAYGGGRDLCKGSVQERTRGKDIDPSGTASEFLSVGPVVRKWLQDVVKPKRVCIAQVTSCLFAIQVTDLLLKVNTGCISSRMLAHALAKHYAAHIIAYGYTLFKPKHHFMLHIPEQLQHFKFLISCFVHERKHKIVKRWAIPCARGTTRNTTGRCSKSAPGHMWKPSKSRSSSRA